jgi:hypothetical protein
MGTAKRNLKIHHLIRDGDKGSDVGVSPRSQPIREESPESRKGDGVREGLHESIDKNTDTKRILRRAETSDTSTPTGNVVLDTTGFTTRLQKRGSKLITITEIPQAKIPCERGI